MNIVIMIMVFVETDELLSSYETVDLASSLQKFLTSTYFTFRLGVSLQNTNLDS